MSLELSLEYIGPIRVMEFKAPSTVLDELTAAEPVSNPIPKNVNIDTARMEKVKNTIAVVFNLCQLILLNLNTLENVDLILFNIINV